MYNCCCCGTSIFLRLIIATSAKRRNPFLEQITIKVSGSNARNSLANHYKTQDLEVLMGYERYPQNGSSRFRNDYHVLKIVLRV